MRDLSTEGYGAVASRLDEILRKKEEPVAPMPEVRERSKTVLEAAHAIIAVIDKNDAEMTASFLGALLPEDVYDEVLALAHDIVSIITEEEE